MAARETFLHQSGEPTALVIAVLVAEFFLGEFGFMKRYEYQTKVIETKGWFTSKLDIDQFDEILNEMGSQGWMLTEKSPLNQDFGATSSIICTFVREIN